LFFYHVNLLAVWLPMLVCDVWLFVQDPSLSAGAWPISYETASSTSGAIERRAPSSGELSLIRSLRDQLQSTQRQLKVVTAKVDVAMSKASHAADCEKFLLDEIETLGKSLQCESLGLFRCVLTWMRRY
jgi:hypothetical protein